MLAFVMKMRDSTKKTSGPRKFNDTPFPRVRTVDKDVDDTTCEKRKF